MHLAHYPVYIDSPIYRYSFLGLRRKKKKTSDRCVFFTKSASERHYDAVMRDKVRNAEEYRAMQALVLEAVHPSQFSALPPSPREIEVKAYILGLECKHYGF